MVGFYIALFVIRPWEKLVPQLGELRIERVYAIAMIAVVTFEGWRIRWSRQTAAVAAFFAAIALSSVLAMQTELAFDPFYKYATLVVFYFVLLSVVRSTYALLFVVTCYQIAMGVYLFKALWEFFINGAHHYTMGVVRLIGIEYTFGGPNDLATSIVVSLPMLLLLFTVRNEFTATWPKWIRMLTIPACLGYLAMAIVAIQLTKSRAGMVAFVVFVGLVALRAQSWKVRLRLALGGLVFLALIWVVLPADTKERLETIWNPKAGPASAHQSAEGRVQGFEAGMKMFDRFPYFGVGPGNFVPYRVRYLDGVPSEAHNLVGQILGETGLISAITFIGLIAVALLNAGKTIRLANRWPHDPTIQVLGRVARASREVILLLLFDGIFGHNLFRFSWLWMAAFALLSWDLAQRTLADRRRRDAQPAAQVAWQGASA
jgi:O-antigen ligase